MKLHALNLFEIMLPLQIKPLQGGDYLATSKELPGLIAQGRSIAETIELAQDVARKLIESYVEHGDPLPPALAKKMKKKSTETTFQIPVSVAFS